MTVGHTEMLLVAWLRLRLRRPQREMELVPSVTLLGVCRSVAQGALAIYLWDMHIAQPHGFNLCSHVCFITYDLQSAHKEIFVIAVWQSMYCTCTLMLRKDFLFTSSSSINRRSSDRDLCAIAPAYHIEQPGKTKTNYWSQSEVAGA